MSINKPVYGPSGHKMTLNHLLKNVLLIEKTTIGKTGAYNKWHRHE